MKKLLKPLKEQLTKEALVNTCAAFIVMLAWVLLTDVGLRQLGDPWLSPAYQFFAAVIFAPLWEELAFRVIPIKIATSLDKALKTKLLWPIIGLSSILFGLGHEGPLQYTLIWQGCMGVVFSYLYIKNNYSYWPNVLLHAGWNFFVMYLLK